MKSGIDTAPVDSTVRPQDDLFRHVNGTWLKTVDIPDDRATYGAFVVLVEEAEKAVREIIDRKSTRLNSSHVAISYAVFCLKKKKIQCTLHAPAVQWNLHSQQYSIHV